MKISYDPKVDAMYIRFKSGRYDHTKKITDEILVDITQDGKVNIHCIYFGIITYFHLSSFK